MVSMAKRISLLFLPQNLSLDALPIRRHADTRYTNAFPRCVFPLDVRLGMGLVKRAFAHMNPFRFLHFDLWMPGARRVRVGFASHRPPDWDL
jgi:hypothetical protein